MVRSGKINIEILSVTDMDGMDKTTDENACTSGKLYQDLKGFYGRINHIEVGKRMYI